MHIVQRVEARRLEFESAADAMFDEAWAGVRELAQPFRGELDLLCLPDALP